MRLLTYIRKAGKIRSQVNVDDEKECPFHAPINMPIVLVVIGIILGLMMLDGIGAVYIPRNNKL